MLILRLGYAYCVFFIYSYFLLCDFGKTRTTFFENTYVFFEKDVHVFPETSSTFYQSDYKDIINTYILNTYCIFHYQQNTLWL